MNTENQTTQIREDSVVREGDGGALKTVRDQHVSGLAYFGMDDSWIKIYRKLEYHWIWQDKPEYLKIWVGLLLRTKWTPGRIRQGTGYLDLQRGELAIGLEEFAKYCNVGVGFVRKFLKLAEKDGMILLKSNKHGTIVKVIKYNELQSSGNQSEQELNKNRTRTEQEPNNSIRSKEVKKERIEEQIDSVSMRSRAFTRPTLQEILGYFIELGSTADEANKFFDHYTANGWKVGKNAMKDWKATARNWNRNKGKFGKEADPQVAIRTKPAGLPKQVVELYEKELPSEIEIERMKALYLSKVSNNE
jgi:hypothetical protein